MGPPTIATTTIDARSSARHTPLMTTTTTLRETSAIKVLEETVYSDGSGSAGLYELFGIRMSGITTGQGGVVTVTPLGVMAGYRSGRDKKIVAQACHMLEKKLQRLVG